MAFVLLLIGAIIVIVAYNGTHGQLADALKKDLPGFLKWGMAIAAILALGFIPGFKTPSRWILALVALVILLVNYQAILAGVSNFTNTSAGDTGTGTVAPDPTAAGATGGQSAASQSGSAPPSPAPPPPPPNPLDPQTYLNMFAPSAGFGGAAGGGTSSTGSTTGAA